MIRVYCDTGGFRKELGTFQDKGIIELVMFRYENENKKISNNGEPSLARWCDMKNYTWQTAPGSWSSYNGSDKYDALVKIIGSQNRQDVLHLDSAFKSGCSFFFTRDNRDILLKKEKIEKLLNIKIMHPDRDWDSFLAEIKSKE